MMIQVYERTSGELKKLDFYVWAVINDNGKISVEQKECYSCEDEMLKRLAIIKIKGQLHGHNLVGFSKNDFCHQIFLDVDRNFDTCFIHYDKDILIQEWNKRINSLMISKDIKAYLYDNEITNIYELLDIIKSKFNVNFNKDGIVIKTKKDNIEISLMFDSDSVETLSDGDEINLFISEDKVPNLSPYLSDEYWDEGIEGTISVFKLNEYIRDFGGLDLISTIFQSYELKSKEELKQAVNDSNSDMVNNFLAMDMLFGGAYNITEHLLLPTLTDSKERYIYECLNNRTIIAYRIIDENESFWYTKEKVFAKNNIDNLEQFNPYKFDGLYSDDLEKLIEAFNNNLNKFLI